MILLAFFITRELVELVLMALLRDKNGHGGSAGGLGSLKEEIGSGEDTNADDGSCPCPPSPAAPALASQPKTEVASSQADDTVLKNALAINGCGRRHSFQQFSLRRASPDKLARPQFQENFDLDDNGGRCSLTLEPSTPAWTTSSWGCSCTPSATSEFSSSGSPWASNDEVHGGEHDPRHPGLDSYMHPAGRLSGDGGVATSAPVASSMMMRRSWRLPLPVLRPSTHIGTRLVEFQAVAANEKEDGEKSRRGVEIVGAPTTAGAAVEGAETAARKRKHRNSVTGILHLARDLVRRQRRAEDLPCDSEEDGGGVQGTQRRFRWSISRP